jgi:hypothetical protein
VGALYDIMGKYLEIPAYKLMGQKQRDAVSLAAWTRPCSPAEFAAEVTHAAAAGYTILKMHTSALWDVLEHVRQAEAVAPPGFRLHLDFNGGTPGSRSPRTVATVLPLLRELESHPAVGFIEDVLARHDVHGWRTVRERTRIPLILGHGGMLGTALDATLGMADLYMLGDRVGSSLARGKALGLLNTQVMFQLVGNALSAALAMHMAAVLPTGTGHCITQMEQYEEDIVRQPLVVQEGFARVPEAPGLGLEIDDEALSRLAANPDPRPGPRRGRSAATISSCGRTMAPSASRSSTRALNAKVRLWKRRRHDARPDTRRQRLAGSPRGAGAGAGPPARGNRRRSQRHKSRVDGRRHCRLGPGARRCRRLRCHCELFGAAPRPHPRL